MLLEISILFTKLSEYLLQNQDFVLKNVLLSYSKKNNLLKTEFDLTLTVVSQEEIMVKFSSSISNTSNSLYKKYLEKSFYDITDSYYLFQDSINLKAKSKKKDNEDYDFTIISPSSTFNDLYLDDKEIGKINDAINLWKYHKEDIYTSGFFDKYSNYSSLTLALIGPPGTGKTLAANCIASSLDSDMIIVKGSEIENYLVGESQKIIRSLFKRAKQEKLVIFFDEADAILTKLRSVNTSTDKFSNSVRAEILQELDNFKDGVVIFASNSYEFDRAFTRRILYTIEFNLPSAKTLVNIWKNQFNENFINDNIDLLKICEKYSKKGVTGSDIRLATFKILAKSLVNKIELSENIFHEAIEEVIEEKMVYAQLEPVNEISEKEEALTVG